MNTLGWSNYANDHEDGNGQFEQNFQFADALTTAKVIAKAWTDDKTMGLRLDFGKAGKLRALGMTSAKRMAHTTARLSGVNCPHDLTISEGATAGLTGYSKLPSA